MQRQSTRVNYPPERSEDYADQESLRALTAMTEKPNLFREVIEGNDASNWKMAIRRNACCSKE